MSLIVLGVWSFHGLSTILTALLLHNLLRLNSISVVLPSLAISFLLLVLWLLYVRRVVWVVDDLPSTKLSVNQLVPVALLFCSILLIVEFLSYIFLNDIWFVKQFTFYGLNQLIVAIAFYLYTYVLSMKRYVNSLAIYIPFLPYPLNLISTFTVCIYYTFTRPKINVDQTIVLGRLKYRVFKFLGLDAKFNQDSGMLEVKGFKHVLAIEKYNALLTFPRYARNKHMLIVGSSGCGKSATLTYLINEFLRKVKDCKVIVIDPVESISNYLNQIGVKHLKVDLSNVDVLNFSEPSDILNFVNAFQVALAKNFSIHNVLGPRQEALLIQVLEEIYRKSPDLLSIDYVIGVLRRLYERYRDNKLMSEVILGVINKLQNLTNLRNARYVLNLEKVLENDLVVFTLTRLNDLEKSLFMEYFLRLLDKFVRTRKLRDVNIVLVVDEAHRILPKELKFNEVVESIVREGRNYNVIVILSTQLLSDLPRSIIENVGVIMYFKPIGVDILERKLLLNVLDIDENDYSNIISKVRFSEFKPGSILKNYALVKTVDIPHALVVEPFWYIDLKPEDVVKDVKVVYEGVVTEKKLTKVEKCLIEEVSPRLDVVVKSSVKAEVVDEGELDICKAYGLNDTECKVLNFIKNYSTVVSRERIVKEFNLSDSYVRKILRKLIDLGLVKEVKYYSCRFGGKLVTFYTFRDYKKRIHRALVIDLYNYLKEILGEDKVKLLNRPGMPDIEVNVNGLRIAVEVETGLKDINDTVKMIIDRAKVYDKVVIVYPTPEKKIEYVKHIVEKISDEVKSKLTITDMYEVYVKGKEIFTKIK